VWLKSGGKNGEGKTKRCLTVKRVREKRPVVKIPKDKKETGRKLHIFPNGFLGKSSKSARGLKDLLRILSVRTS